jgi:hypothetical protein
MVPSSARRSAVLLYRRFIAGSALRVGTRLDAGDGLSFATGTIAGEAGVVKDPQGRYNRAR